MLHALALNEMSNAASLRLAVFELSCKQFLVGGEDDDAGVIVLPNGGSAAEPTVVCDHSKQPNAGNTTQAAHSSVRHAFKVL